jgi:glycosyltransferase involved in cell wall biosynthesis
MTRASMRLLFAIPGDLSLLTGGYSYGRQILARLPGFGIDAVHCELPGSFPNPSPRDLQDAVHAVNAAISPGCIVLIDGLAYGAFPEAAIRAISAPIVALCHHPLGLEAGLEPERSCALIASETNALALATRVIVTSTHTARILHEDFHVPASRIAVAEPGTEPAPRAIGTGAPLSLLAVGSITPRKAFGVLAEALAGLKDLSWRLSIVGGTQRAPETAMELQRLIEARGLSPRIQCPGELKGAALEDVFHRSDIFVSPSLYEGYGMALAEAMARGLPIITTTGGAASETVPDEAALKVPPGSAAALREALRSLIGDSALRKRLSDASWRAGQGLAGWDDTASAVARTIRDAAEASNIYCDYKKRPM